MIKKLAFLLALLAWPVLASAQNLPAPTLPLTGNEVVPCVQGGAYKGCTPAEIAALNPNSLNVVSEAGVLTSFGTCGGVDDTTALTNWAAAITAHSAISSPAGPCVFKSPIVQPVVDYVHWQGHNTVFSYGGASTAVARLFTTGSTSSAANCAISHWTIRDVTVVSSTVMVSGDGWYLGHSCKTDLTNVSAGYNKGTGANSNLFNGWHIESGNVIYARGIWGRGSGSAELVDGDASNTLIGLYEEQVDFSTSNIGIHIAGNANIQVGAGDIHFNDQNVLIDTSVTAIGNKQILFGGDQQTQIDVSCTALNTPVQGCPAGAGAGVGFHVSDTMGAATTVIALPGWIASSANQGVLIDSGVTAKIIGTGRLIFNSGGDGVQNNSAGATFDMTGASLRSNGTNGAGYGFNNVAVQNNVSLVGIGGCGTNVSGDAYGAAIACSNAAGWTYNGLQTIFNGNGTRPGSTAPPPAANTVVAVQGSDGNTGRVQIMAFGMQAMVTSSRADGTAAAPTQTLSGDDIGEFNALGWNTTTSASFTGVIAGTSLTTSAETGTVAIGQTINGAGIPGGVTIASGSGHAWVLTTGTVNLSLAVSSESMNSYAGSWLGPISAVHAYAAENIASGHFGSKLCLATTAIASTSLTDNLCVLNDGTLAAKAAARPGQALFANLGTVDASPQVGDMLNITDASACTVNVAVSAGSGTTHSCPTVYNGVGWIAMVTH